MQDANRRAQGKTFEWRGRRFAVGVEQSPSDLAQGGSRAAAGTARHSLGVVLRCLAASAVFTWTGSAFGRESSPRPLIVGVSAPLTGANASYGNGLVDGLQAAVTRFNAMGGLEGRRLELSVRDDAGQVDRAIANTKTFIDDGAVALTGYHGASVVEASLSLADKVGVPMIGAASSSESLRNASYRTIFNLRAGAGEEIAAIVDHLNMLEVVRVAIAGEPDGLGKAAIESLRIELARVAIRPVVEASLAHQVSLAQAADLARRICQSEAQAVVLAVDVSMALKLIHGIRSAGCNPQIYVMSETGIDLPAQAKSPNDIAGVIVSQVLPPPSDVSNLFVSEFRRDLPKPVGGASAYAALEGYLYGRVVIEALRQCGRSVARECVMGVMQAGRIEIAGYPLRPSSRQRKGGHFVELTILDDRGQFMR